MCIGVILLNARSPRFFDSCGFLCR